MASAQPTIQFTSALSDLADTSEAVGDVLRHITRQMTSSIDLVIFAVTVHHRPQIALVQRLIEQALSPRVMLGTTAEGVIGVRRELEGVPGVTVLAASLPGVSLEPFSYAQIDWPESPDDNASLREQFRLHDASHPVRAMLLLADPFSTPMTRVLPSIARSFPGVPVVGGMASAARAPGGNRLVMNRQLLRDGAVGLAIGGNVRVDCTVSQGCRPVGRPVVITRSQRHIVQHLGGRPALTVAKEVVESLNDQDRDLAQSGGLLVGRVIDEYKHRFGRGDFLIRGLLGVDEDSRYIAIGDPLVRVGQTIQFHVHDGRTAEEDLALMLEVQKLQGPASGALLFSCNGRGARLFDRGDVDPQLVHDALGDVPLAGFFASGEIGPVGGQNFVLGHTASLVAFREPESLQGDSTSQPAGEPAEDSGP
jgi:small ligand-binding sensory domain FIST